MKCARFDEYDDVQDLVAFLRLRIITAALNDGWHPTFDENEYRYYPWFRLYTEEEYKYLDDDEKERCRRVVGRTSREVADCLLAEDDEDALNPKQRNNYAVFFCIGAAWAMTQNNKSIK